MSPEKIVTFPWGADIHKYSPGDDGGLRARKEWDKDTFVLLSTRAWAPIYGVEVLAKAFVQAARKRPELRLFMLSGGSQATLIRRIYIQGDVLDKVEFPGQVNQHALPNYFRAADLYISTSHSDGTSISMLEALASGCPVVLSDIPGNKEWIDPGQQGWFFKDGNVNSLANAILYAVDNRDHLHQMGRAARVLAEKRGDWEMNFPQLMNAYNIAMSGTN